MDRITSHLVDDFISNNELNISDQSKSFELFCIYSIISKENSESFDIEKISIGYGNDTGIDGIGILVNGRFIESIEEIDDLFEINNYLEAVFIFIQSKTSSSFDSGDIGKFLFGISDFFEQNPKLPRNELIKEKAEIMDYLYTKSASMIKGNPKCKIYYVTTGNWNDDPNLKARFDVGKDDLIKKNLFSDVETYPTGAPEIQKFYQITKETISREIVFPNKVILSDIEGVNEAYIGTLEFNEFKKLITDNEGNILNSVFYDNVRAFQGDNPVNVKIEKTIKDKKFDQFVVLNNGITIVAKKIHPIGNRLTINDYQIVNGCQTSHVLYHQKDKDGIDKINLPIRIIVSENESLTNEIIISTNSQTIVKPEELEALSEFQKNLELFYKTIPGEGQLYYERRSKQFNNDNSILKTRIITIPIQIKSFAAMFLRKPHTVSRYYGSIVKTLGEKIFRFDHKPIVYYCSALAYYRLEYLFRTNSLNSKYKKCRFHLLMIVSHIISDEPIPQFNSRSIDDYCQKIIDVLLDPQKSSTIFNQAASIINKLGLDLDNRDVFKTQATTELLLKEIWAEKK